MTRRAEEPIAIIEAPLPAVEYRLSYGQAALWFLHRLAPESAAYNLTLALRVLSPLDQPALRRAASALSERHPALRTTIHSTEGGPVQRVHPEAEIAVSTRDAAGWGADRLRWRLEEEAHRSFDLEVGPPARLAVFSRAPRDHVLLLTLHHIVSDFWSMTVLVRELGALYSREMGRAEAPLEPVAVSLGQLVERERRLIASEAGDRHRAYWRRQLAEPRGLLALPTDRPRPPVQKFRGAAETWFLSPDLRAGLRALAGAADASLFVTLAAVFQSLLHRLTGERDLTIGTPTAGRSEAGLANLVGYLVNPVALRVRLSPGETFRSLLRKTRRTVLAALEHRGLPFACLVDELQPQRDASRSPLFQVMLVLERAPRSEEQALAACLVGRSGSRLRTGALELESVALRERWSQFDLTLSIAELDGGVAAALRYDTELFDATTIGRWLQCFQRLATSVLEQPDAPLAALPLLDRQQRHQLLREWAAPPRRSAGRDLSLGDLFELQAARTPEAVALVRGDRQVSYGELDRRADRLAHRLRRLGVGPEVAVGVCLERSVALVAALLGVLKAGGLYVPLDPSYPPERLAFLLEDSRVSVLVSRPRLVAELPPHGAALLAPETGRAGAGAGDGNPERLARGHHLAYLIYTSGSSGRPKGVAIEHRSAVALVDWARKAFPPPRLDGVWASTSVSFDLSVFELFAPLCSGGRVFLAANALDLSALETGGVTLVNTVPAVMTEVMKRRYLPASVRVVGLAGEPLPGSLVDQVYRRGSVREVWNLYGPSEDATYSTATRVPRSRRGEPSIGVPVAGSRALVLDRRGQPVPVGVAGHLHLGGAGLARGYFRRPRLTAERFVPDPLGGRPGERLYRTGDLARHRSAGDLEFLGRLDRQIKVRGFRIEPGEVEAILSSHPGVRHAAVTLSGAGGDQRLVAWLESSERLEPPAVRRLAEGARSLVRERLPEYMRPSRIAVLECLPLTPNGKVDRVALAARPLPPATARAAGGPMPGSELERDLAGIWRVVLGTEEFGVDDNFFEVGGHSLLLFEVHDLIHRRLGRQVPVLDLLRHPTIRALARRCGQPETAERRPSPAEAAHDPAQLRRRRASSMRQRRLERQRFRSAGRDRPEGGRVDG